MTMAAAIIVLVLQVMLASCNGRVLPVTGDQYFVRPGMTTPVFWLWEIESSGPAFE